MRQLTQPEFATAMEPLGPFERAPHLAVAVSGGADSMALLLLTQEWAAARDGKVTALTVDHGLRPEATDEAAQLHRWCKTLGIEHRTLRWNPPTIMSGMMEQARNARYILLTDWCRDHHVLHLLTAHHQGDQVETFFFRLSRGSGLDGLACMPSLSDVSGVRLLRPLLSVPKARLEATLLQAGHAWIEDPTNQNTRYSRNHIRQQLAGLPQNLAIAERTSTVISCLTNTRNMLENKSVEQLTQTVSLFPGGYALIDYPRLQSLPDEIGFRLLASLITTLTGNDHPPRTAMIERLWQTLRRHPKRHTLAGLQFAHQPARQRLLVCREPRAIAPAMPLTPGATSYWDNRFEVRWQGRHPPFLQVAALGKNARLFERAHRHIPKAALSALPAFWHLEKLVAVPHLAYKHPEFASLSCFAHLRPAKALVGKAFFSMNRCQDQPLDEGITSRA